MSTSVTSVTNHFPSAENGFSTTTSASVSSGATTVQLNSVAGYDNGEVVVFVIDPTDATKKQTFTGIVDTAGTQITSVVWTAGSNQSHSLGATVVDYATATHISMISKGLSVSLNQNGTLKTNSVTTTNITDSNVTVDKLASNAVTTAKIADDAVTDDKLDYPRFWQEIARTTLTVAGDTITVSSIPARKYLRVIIYTTNSGQISQLLRFNNDSAANYSYTTSSLGAADTSTVSSTGVSITGGATYQMYTTIEIMNTATLEKIGYFKRFNSNTAGAATAPTRMEGAFKWVNTSVQINRIDVTNPSGSGDFAIGAEIIVLGHD